MKKELHLTSYKFSPKIITILLMRFGVILVKTLLIVFRVHLAMILESVFSLSNT